LKSEIETSESGSLAFCAAFFLRRIALALTACHDDNIYASDKKLFEGA